MSKTEKKFPQEKRWLKIREAAQYLNVHPKTLYDLIAQKKFPAVRISGTRTLRIDKRELDERLERQLEQV